MSYSWTPSYGYTMTNNSSTYSYAPSYQDYQNKLKEKANYFAHAASKPKPLWEETP